MNKHFNLTLNWKNDIARKILVAIWVIPFGLGSTLSFAEPGYTDSKSAYGNSTSVAYSPVQNQAGQPEPFKPLMDLANPNTPEASDGSIVQEEYEDHFSTTEGFSRKLIKSKTTSLDANGFEGSGITGSDFSAESETESVEETTEILSLKPATGIGIESIIGIDQRVFVPNTTTYPFRTMALITFSGGRCSGVLIGKDTVLTAGHCVHDGNWSTDVRVYPGWNGKRAPFGSCDAKRLYTVSGWTTNRDPNYDYGVVKLDCDIGLRTGWLGWHTQTNSLNGVPSYISGYPGDKPLTQWYSSDRIRISGGHTLFYRNDTTGGMSGSPVLSVRSTGSAGCIGFCAIAIHTNGLFGKWPYNTYNRGTRITSGVHANILNWRNAQ